ncbi:kelch-like protein 24 isoform X2 [Styela clava]|uniref:kelch-like protein 24 isoform X2 n=1 Tax=Styela clava TaxID=7725 RepID=UPI0019394959|nr:kelch-like protein 24 isoform X2 [Styela clava]
MIEAEEKSDKLSDNTFLFSVPTQGSSILEEFNNMRTAGVLVDVVIRVDRRKFPCHRVVLAANSQYFKAMFSYGLKESREKIVSIHGVSSDTMGLIIEYAYTGRCVFLKCNAAEIMMAADLFQFLTLKDAAVKYLHSTVDIKNCLSIRKLAENHSCENLLQKAVQFTREHFKEIVLQDEYLDLTINDLISYLTDDELSVNKEDVVFEAAMKWIEEKEEGQNYLPRVLKAVRLPFVTPDFLRYQVAENSLIKNSDNCIKQVEEARKFQVSGQFREGCDGLQRRPRKSTSKEVLIVFGGESRIGNFHECVQDVSYYDPTTRKWATMDLVPGTLHTQAFGAVSLGYDIYITGGTLDNKAVNDVRIFYTYLNKWCNVAPMLQARYHHSAVVVNEQVYAVGGSDGTHCLDHVERYILSENKWVATEPLVHAVKCPAVAAYDNKLYVFGGFTDGYIICQSIQIYNPATCCWIAISCPSIDYTCAHAIHLNHKIYLLGGCSKIVKVYDPENDSVMQITHMETKRDNCRATVVGGKIYVTGGVSESSGSSLDSVECYCPALDKWESVAPMPRRLYRHGSVSIRIPVYRKENPNRTINDATVINTRLLQQPPD